MKTNDELVKGLDVIQKKIETFDQLESTIGQVSKSLCGKENATPSELLQAVSQLKTRLAQVEKELAFKEKCLEWRYRDIVKAEDVIDELTEKLSQVERERDAAINDCGRFPCKTCEERENGDLCPMCVVKGSYRSLHQWRGVCEENTKGE